MALSQDRREDADLMAGVAAGDRRALARLIERHAGGLRRVAARYLGDTAEAEDVVQETFMQAWRYAPRFDARRAAASTWLWRIAVNRCFDRRRRRALRRVVGLEVASEVVDPAPSAPMRAEDRQRLAVVSAAIAALPARQRMALLLSAVAGMETMEVAASLGTSPGAVEQLLVRARRRLRAALDEDAT